MTNLSISNFNLLSPSPCPPCPFEYTNSINVDAPLLDNLHASLSFIALYLAIIGFIALTLHLLDSKCNWFIGKKIPFPHLFIKHYLVSSLEPFLTLKITYTTLSPPVFISILIFSTLVVNIVTDITIVPETTSITETLNRISPIVTEINRLFIQLEGFVNRYHDFVNLHNFIVAYDDVQGMTLEIAEDISESASQYYIFKLNTIHDLIRHHYDELNRLFRQLSELEASLQGTEYRAQLPALSDRLYEIMDQYPHIRNTPVAELPNPL